MKCCDIRLYAARGRGHGAGPRTAGPKRLRERRLRAVVPQLWFVADPSAVALNPVPSSVI